MKDENYEPINWDDFSEYLTDCQLERLFGMVDVERKNGMVLKDCEVYRTEKLADIHDTESCYEVEYWARDYAAPGVEYEEIYLGNMSGENLIIKERNYNE